MAGQGKYFGYYSKYLEKLLESFQQVAWFDLEDDWLLVEEDGKG